MTATRDELTSCDLLLSPDGWVVRRNRRSGAFTPAFHRSQVDPALFNALRGVLVLYNCLNANLQGMLVLSESAEAQGQAGAAESFDALAAALHLGMRVAEKGPETFTLVATHE